MKFSRIKKLLIAVVLMAGLFVGLHSTPALATRTYKANTLFIYR